MPSSNMDANKVGPHRERLRPVFRWGRREGVCEKGVNASERGNWVKDKVCAFTLSYHATTTYAHPINALHFDISWTKRCEKTLLVTTRTCDIWHCVRWHDLSTGTAEISLRTSLWCDIWKWLSRPIDAWTILHTLSPRIWYFLMSSSAQ